MTDVPNNQNKLLQSSSFLRRGFLYNACMSFNFL